MGQLKPGYFGKYLCQKVFQEYSRNIQKSLEIPKSLEIHKYLEIQKYLSDGGRHCRQDAKLNKLLPGLGEEDYFW